VLQGDPATAGPVLDSAIEATRLTGRQRLLSDALTMASIAASMSGDREAARRHLAEAEALAPRLDDPVATLGLIQAQTFDGLFTGNLATVRSASAEGVRISREIGDVYRLTMMLMNRGTGAFLEGELDEARPFLVEALRRARETDDRVAMFFLLDALGCVAAGSGQAATAARLLAAADVIRGDLGATTMPFMTSSLDRARRTAATALGAARFETELRAGGALGPDEAIRLALGESAREAGARSGEAGDGVLGKREMEVARLVARGLTNKEIGARLLISESTVASHVRGILNKLGFNSRAQIASWSADR
jgi:DNA-binding CsgD family transcriptional regulator